MKNLLLIISKEIKQSIRNSKVSLMLILFPIVMIFILNLVLSKAFNNQTIGNVNILYSASGNGPLTQGFISMTKEAEKSGFRFTQTSQTNIPDINKTQYACYIRLTDGISHVIVYENSRLTVEASIAESMLTSFIQRYNVMAQIAKVNPAALQTAGNVKTNGYVTVESLDKRRAPDSLDYYAVAMLTLFTLYSSISALWAISSERIQRTGSRILTSPVKKYQFLTGKVIGVTFVTFIQMSIVFLFSKYVLHAYLGSHMGMIMLIYASEIIMAVGIGIGISFMINDNNLSSGILNIVPVLFGFLGGAYVPLSNMGDFIQKLSVISPIKWTNDALFKVIYANDFSTVPGAVIINLSIAALLIVVSSVIFRKEALIR